MSREFSQRLWLISAKNVHESRYPPIGSPSKSSITSILDELSKSNTQNAHLATQEISLADFFNRYPNILQTHPKSS